jgi:fructokinase
MPGSLHPKTGLVQVSNTKVLEGQNVKKDLEEKLGFEIKIANDADCLALSEAVLMVQEKNSIQYLQLF